MRHSVIALNCFGHVDEVEAWWRLWPVRNSPTLLGGVFNFCKRFSDREPLRPNLPSTAVKERLIHDFSGEASAGALCEKKDVVRTVGSALTERACKCWERTLRWLVLWRAVGELSRSCFSFASSLREGESKIGDRAAF